MDISELDLFIVAMSNYLRLNQPFTIIGCKKNLSVEPIDIEETNSDLRSIKIFSSYLIENVAILNYRDIPKDNYLKIRLFVDLLDKFVKAKKKKYKKLGTNLFKEAEDKIFRIRLGGKISSNDIENIDQEFRKFLKINKIDYKLFALAIQLGSNLALTFQVDRNLYEEVVWKDLVKEKLFDESGRLYGYRFFYKERLVLETDTELLMTESFCFLYQGITSYHPQNSLEILPLDKRASTGKAFLEIVTSVRGSSFAMLYREDGAIYCIGLQKWKITAPVDGYFELYKCRTLFEITNEEYAEILSAFEIEKIRKDNLTEIDFLSVIQRNLGLEAFPNFSWKELFMKKCKVLKMNKKIIWKWLEKVIIARNGEQSCFE